jgi:hypothetical protein
MVQAFERFRLEAAPDVLFAPLHAFKTQQARRL